MGLFKFLVGLASDTYTDSKGYLRYKSNNKLVHRDSAEEKLGRKLRRGEVVHCVCIQTNANFYS
jgi:hypothetical protein